MSVCIVWFERDLRLADNPALFYACRDHDVIIPLFIHQAKSPKAMGAAQRWWLHCALVDLANIFAQHHCRLILRRGAPLSIFKEWVKKQDIDAVYWNRRYEPQAIKRDNQIKAWLTSQSIQVKCFNGSLLFEPENILNQSGDYFKVFTPFWRHCCQKIHSRQLYPVPSISSIESKQLDWHVEHEAIESFSLLPNRVDWASKFTQYWKPTQNAADKQLQTFIDLRLSGYEYDRDFPAVRGTSRLSPYLHFGQIGPWQIWQAISDAMLEDPHKKSSGQRYLTEIGWREFSYYLLYHFPDLPLTNFRATFDCFPWKNRQNALRAWQRGRTGYPLIDAGMRELWETGYMHNRVRMLVASFLTKDLLIDWRQGAAWFLDTLLDADLANNSMGWQWIAGCGVDAAPYFRIFNPITQGEKFDPEGVYVKQFIPQLANLPKKWIHKPWMAPEKILKQCEIVLGKDYPKPIVNHDNARRQALP